MFDLDEHTVTDDQIKALRERACAARQAAIGEACNDALNVPLVKPRERMSVSDARAFCAEVINQQEAGSPDYTRKVDELLVHARDFTCRDFLDLAFAALDQFGLSADNQRRISQIIKESE